AVRQTLFLFLRHVVKHPAVTDGAIIGDAHQNVAVLAAEVPLEVAKPEEPQVVEQLRQAPIVAVKPTGEEVEVATVVTPPPAAELKPDVAPAPAPAPAAPKLPQTASPLPLIALLGLLASGGAWALRLVQKRVL
ncbi:MAG: hypothetical protein ABSD56_00905, partial [Bryobacteraceae bacterium]